MTPTGMVAWATQVTMWFVWVLLGGRFLLRLFNADTTNRIVSWWYDNSASVLKPFVEQFPHARAAADGFVVELSTLFALVAFTLAGMLVLALAGNYGRKADGAVPRQTFGVSIRRRG